MLNSFVQMPSGGSQSQESPRARDLADQIDQPTRPGREENTPQARNESKSRRQTLFYNASNYDALASLGVAQSQVYQVVLLGTEYVESTKIGAKPYTTYRLRVSHKNGTKWATTRRYREFRSLMEKLKSKYSGVPHGFPPKKILRNMNPLLIDRRHMALQTWLDKVLQTTELQECPEVVHFLEENKMEEGLVEITFEQSMVRIDLEKMGFLWKMHNKQWKRRWFILRHGILYKYYSHQDKYPYGQYIWKDAIVQKLEVASGTKGSRQFCFLVTTRKGKQHLFAAESDDEREEWITAIVGGPTNDSYADVVDAPHAKVLGVPLHEITPTNHEGIPVFLTCLMDYIEATATGEQDLFTTAPDPELISQIQEGVVDSELIKNPHAVGGLIQVFLRELPVPLLTWDLRACFLGVYDISQDATRIHILRSLCEVLPHLHYNLLRHLCLFLRTLIEKGAKLDQLCDTFSVLILRSPKATEIQPSSTTKDRAPLKKSYPSTSDLTAERTRMNKITELLILHCNEICPYSLEMVDDDAHDTAVDELEFSDDEDEYDFAHGNQNSSSPAQEEQNASQQELDEATSSVSVSKKRERDPYTRAKSSMDVRTAVVPMSSHSQDDSAITGDERKRKKKKRRRSRLQRRKDDTQETSQTSEFDKPSLSGLESAESSQVDTPAPSEPPSESFKTIGSPHPDPEGTSTDLLALKSKGGLPMEEESKYDPLSYLDGSESDSPEHNAHSHKGESHLSNAENTADTDAEEERDDDISMNLLSPGKPLGHRNLTISQSSLMDTADEEERAEIEEDTILSEDEQRHIRRKDEAGTAEESIVEMDHTPEGESLEQKAPSSSTTKASPPVIEIGDNTDAATIEESTQHERQPEASATGATPDHTSTKDTTTTEESDEEEEPPAPLDRIPRLEGHRLESWSKARGPSGRQRPSRRFKSPIVINEFTEIGSQQTFNQSPPASPKKVMTPEQQMMMEMSRLFKLKSTQ